VVIDSEIALLVDAALVLLPPNAATIEYVPAASPAEHLAVRTLPVPASATAVQPDSATPLLLNATVPVGDEPVTVAVKVTLAPATAGFADVARAVVVVVTLGALPAEDTCTVTPVAVDDRTLNVVPYVGSLNVWPASNVPSLDDVVPGVRSSSCVSLEHPLHDDSNGAASLICTPL